MSWMCFRAIVKKSYPKRNLVPKTEMQCLICNEVLLAAVSTDCNHHFCELCFQRSLARSNQCAACSSPLPSYSRNIELDNTIKKSLSERQLGKLRGRKHQQNFARRINAVEIGMGLDFQDKRGRWRQGTIKQIITQKKAAALLWIRFEETAADNQLTVVDELIEQTSLRIAPLGFITAPVVISSSAI